MSDSDVRRSRRWRRRPPASWTFRLAASTNNHHRGEAYWEAPIKGFSSRLVTLERRLEADSETGAFSMNVKQRKIIATTGPNLASHERECLICAHPSREEIERDFIAWKSPTKITAEYKLRNRASVYRHAHATGLFPKRARNVRAALERFIEQAGDVPVNATAIVQAIATFARINAEGHLIERSERVNLNDLFERMTPEELQAYAADGTLPPWFSRATGATPVNGALGNSNG
jgi:hypothetical protein